MLAQRDPYAFALLYTRYLDPIHRYCYRRLGSREAAEDATSLVFAKALSALPRYHDTSFRSWLFTIAHHVVIDHSSVSWAVDENLSTWDDAHDVTFSWNIVSEAPAVSGVVHAAPRGM